MESASQTKAPTTTAASPDDLKVRGLELAAGLAEVVTQLHAAILLTPFPQEKEPPQNQELEPIGLERLRNDMITLQGEYDSILANSIRAESKLRQAEADSVKLEHDIAYQRGEVAALGDAYATQVKAAEALRGEEVHRAEALRLREEQAELLARDGEAAHLLMEKLWPAWLLRGELQEWKQEIEIRVFDVSAPASFGLLFAALHGYNAALRDPDAKGLYDNVRDVGRRLYQWLEESGRDQEAAAPIAESWASAINAEAGSRCKVQVAVPGNPAVNQWMIFTPRGGSSPDVAAARSWCVLDPQGRSVHRAEVTV